MIHEYHTVIERLREIIEDELANSRERALALTKLDEMEMWIKKADASNVFEELGVDRPRKLTSAEQWLKDKTAGVVQEELSQPSQSPRVHAINMLIAEAKVMRSTAVNYVEAIEGAHIYLDMGGEPSFKSTPDTLFRAASALMVKWDVTEQRAADLIQVLNNAGIYLRDS